MEKKPLVSILIIFLNEEKFIQEAIDSVFAQTYDTWELLLVDDGSTDKSTQIARCYENQYPNKVRYLEHQGHQNRGMSASRNLGFRHARGDYTAYLDGDDIWVPQKLEEQVAILAANPEAVMVCGPLLEWYSWSENAMYLFGDHLYGVGENGRHPYADTIVQPPKLLALFLRQEDFIPGGALIERWVLEQVGGSEEIFRGSYEDAVVHVKICLSYPVYVSSQCWYKYRIHPNSWERNVIRVGQMRANRLFYLNWVKTYLSEQGVQDSEIWQVYRYARQHCQHLWFYQMRDRRYVISKIEGLFVQVGRRILPNFLRDWLWQLWERYRPTSI